jgi:hypothetical protein
MNRSSSSSPLLIMSFLNLLLGPTGQDNVGLFLDQNTHVVGVLLLRLMKRQSSILLGSFIACSYRQQLAENQESPLVGTTFLSIIFCSLGNMLHGLVQ